MWHENDEYGATWQAATAWAALLTGRAANAPGPRERAGRATAALLIYQATILHRRRPGLLTFDAVQQLLTADNLTAALQEVHDDPRHHYARDQLGPDVDLATGLDTLRAALATALRDGLGPLTLEAALSPNGEVFGHLGSFRP